MAVVFVLAHFDDEYCALPLIREARAAGEACRFLYVADYRSAAHAARRLRETRRFLASLGLDPACAIHAGAASGVFDGSVIDGLATALAALRGVLDGPVTRLVVPAWEGGHPDHDACAVLAVVLAREMGGPPIRQFGLYTGRRFPRPFYRACWPIPENGPATPTPMRLADWLRWMAAVRFFPSQAWNWLGLWPAMFLTFAQRGGFASQALAPERVRERPHAGRLHYEWMFRTPYERVRERAGALLG
ncbi:MAG: PIG-L family deacetylase [Phenylobacterium sp.]